MRELCFNWLCSERDEECPAPHGCAGPDGPGVGSICAPKPCGLWVSVIAPGLFIGPGWLPELKVRIRKEGSRKMGEDITQTAGIDTGKKKLNLGFWPKAGRLEIDNRLEQFERLAAVLEQHRIKRVGIESTATYHMAVSEFLCARGFEVIVLQPLQVKAFAKIHLRRAKNDKMDAEMVAGCAAAQSEVHAPHSAEIARLAEHLTFIEQCEENAARLKTQLERFTNDDYRKKIKREIAHFRLMIRHELKVLEKELRLHQRLSKRLDLVLSIPGAGLRSALGALIRMPELGTLSREQAAALLGVAPMDDDSGEHQGMRFIQGGRARARKSLYMAAFAASFHHNPLLKAFYARLVKRGKPHTLALVACTRKLVIIINTVLQRGTPWENREGMPCPQ
jgi:transposase